MVEVLWETITEALHTSKARVPSLRTTNSKLNMHVLTVATLTRVLHKGSMYQLKYKVVATEELIKEYSLHFQEAAMSLVQIIKITTVIVEMKRKRESNHSLLREHLLGVEVEAVPERDR